MTSSRNVGQEVAGIIKAARRGQEALGHAIRTSAGKMRSATPQRRELNLPFADRLPKPEEVAGNVRGIAARLPKPEDLAGNARGLARRLPKPEELAGSAASLAGKLMASQRKFADQVLRAATPQLPAKRGSAGDGTAQESTAQNGTSSGRTAKGSTAKSGTAKGGTAKSSTAKSSTAKPATRAGKDGQGSSTAKGKDNGSA